MRKEKMMILTHFNLQDQPFKKDVDITDLFEGTGFREGQKRLDYLKDNRGIMLFTGEPGTGKTTLLRKFNSSLNQNCYKVFYLPLATVKVMDFYRQINFALGGTQIYRKTDLFINIQKGIRSMVSNRKIVPVFVFDEAHLLHNDNFHELQIIFNFDFDSVMPAIVILAGQSHLRDKLSREINSSFNQRISLKYHFTPLSKAELVEYIRHSLAIVGGSTALFSESAMEAIFNNSRGNIRVSGNIAIKALTAAAINNNNTVTEEHVFLAAKEL